MNRRRFLTLLGGALGAAEFFGIPSGWLAPVKTRVFFGTYTGDGATCREIFICDPMPAYKALRIIQETGKPSGDFNVKGEKYRYEVVE